MSLRPWLIVLLFALPAATGCLQDAEEEAGPFAVVTVTGEIVEHGEERAPHACGRPVWSAGLSAEDRGLTVLEDRSSSEAVELVVWDTVVEVHAGNWSACEWPVANLSTTGSATWTLRHQALERSFDVQRTGETVTVGGTELSPGDNRTVRVDVEPEGSNDTYRGNVTFTFLGLWPGGNLETVADEEAIRGSQGVVRTW